MLAAALAYAVAGFPVLPLDGKVPRNRGGLTNASTDPAIISEWWGRWPSADVGIRTGAESGLLVLDVDVPAGLKTLAELERRHGKLRTACVLTGSGGWHHYFRYPGEPVRNSAGRLGDGLDVRGDGGYVVAPPSLHESGRLYKWTRGLERGRKDVPPWLLEAIGARANAAPKVLERIPEGQRRDELLKVAGALKRRGLDGAEVMPTLRELNKRCSPPLSRHELETIAFPSTIEPDPEVAIKTAPVVPVRPVEAVLDTFRSWLHLPDAGLLYVVCAAVAANKVQTFDPTWLIVVGAAGSGKTEALSATSRLDGVHLVGTLTEASLLSGTPRKDAVADASGGLLREIGESGIVVLKDFGSVLSMHRDARAAVLAALRELYDGSWTRLVGVDGGRRLHWEGRFGLLAGATAVLDQHHGAIAQLGERFLLYRITVDDAYAQARSSLAHHGRERTMRRELSEAVAGLFAGPDFSEPPPMTGEDEERLIALSILVARARSPVVRDSYRREIELVPDSEAPGRIVGALGRLLTGLRMVGVDELEAWRLTVKTGLDSMPATRLRALEYLLGKEKVASTTDVATALDLPNPTIHRTLEDLAAHGLLRRESQGQGKADLWCLQDWVRETYGAATSSETSESHDATSSKTSEPGTSLEFQYTNDDISEEVLF